METQLSFEAVLRPDPMSPKGVKDPLSTHVGARLRAIGEGHKLTQTEIAKASGVRAATISTIEQLHGLPRIDTIERLATALDVSPSWLAFGDQGTLPFRQRYPRDVLPAEPPRVCLAQRELQNRYQGVGMRLASARKALCLSMRGLSEPAGVSHQIIFYIESGVNVPLVSNIERLAVALDVSPGWLAFGEGEGPEG